MLSYNVSITYSVERLVSILGDKNRPFYRAPPPLHSRPRPRTTIKKRAFRALFWFCLSDTRSAKAPLGPAQASPNTLNTHDTQRTVRHS